MDLSAQTPCTGAEFVPDPADAAAYAWVLEHGRLDPVALAAHLGRQGLDPSAAATALDRLTAWQLLQPDPGDPGRCRALPPQTAIAALAAPVEAAIQRSRAELAHRQAQVAGFLAYHRQAARETGGAEIEVIADLQDVRAALDRASAECRSEVLTSQPGGGSRVPAAMEEALRRDRALLGRGVRMRTLYHHTARFNGPSQAYVEAATALGAEYRTAHELFGRLIVFDRELAFLPLSDGTWGAVVVRQEALLAYLCGIFEQAWTLARPFAAAAEDGLEQVSQELDRTIVRMLAAGLKDEAIARRLGMSLRTARRHIADIMDELGAESRFQAGVAAAKAGLLDD
ncbi:helix-turn-helix transcriptional regulator [Kitasatospora cheerisanensis]|uniref:LuxR family transcriptional regulator n=1 Tax=Kitasatospora cheerisanensis KCTC 2395 TaxID=1348663 RepID=A0A066YTA4_9ACTN|nr:helix-turn-helix transcriptional regulator [Kitasatospora cheerisanensis]KDN83184.1 LuxR family transcriptional regulator [Kitasatospora cheerisanensis KCTC 2395]